MEEEWSASSWSDDFLIKNAVSVLILEVLGQYFNPLVTNVPHHIEIG